jgi:hypothetical protein
MSDRNVLDGNEKSNAIDDQVSRTNENELDFGKACFICRGVFFVCSVVPPLFGQQDGRAAFNEKLFQKKKS